MKYKQILLCVFITFVIEIGTTFIRYQSLMHDFWISFIIYFTVIFLLLKKFTGDKKTILFSFLFTIIGLTTLGWILDGAFPLLGLTNVIGTIVACVFGYIFFVLKKKTHKFLVLILCSLLCISYVVSGYDLWVHYVCYGNFTGKVRKRIPIDLFEYVDGYKTEQSNSLNNRLIVLDFFNTSCPICFAKFPILQNIYDQYKSNPRIAVYAINIPINRDTIGMAINMVRTKKYTFPVLIGRNKLDSVFEIYGYPTTVLLKNDVILYKGDIENIDKYIDEELKSK